MVDIKRILLTTDFSECAKSATTFAVDLAMRYGAKLDALHVIHQAALEVPDFGMGLAFPGYVEEIPRRRKEFEMAAIQALENEFLPDDVSSIGISRSVRFGVPYVEILKFASEQAIDLIVLGTHGRTGLSHVLLGSVAERVVQKATCSVLTVHAFQANLV